MRGAIDQGFFPTRKVSPILPFEIEIRPGEKHPKTIHRQTTLKIPRQMPTLE